MSDRKFEAMISRGMISRFVEVEAVNYTEAYRQAESLCQDGEVVRGVTALDEIQAETWHPWGSKP